MSDPADATGMQASGDNESANLCTPAMATSRAPDAGTNSQGTSDSIRWWIWIIINIIYAIAAMYLLELHPMRGSLKAIFWTPIDFLLQYEELWGFALSFFGLTLAFWLLIIWCDSARSPEPAATDKVSKEDKEKARATKEGIKRLQAYHAAIDENKWYSAAYDAQRELLKQRAAELRDKERIIQNQATEVARFDHRAEAAKVNLKNKSDYADGLLKQLEINTITIEDRDATIRTQAQHLMNSEWDRNAMANQIDEKDQQIWDITGQNTAAQQEITKLKAAVENQFTESDYCAALHTIDRRDQDVAELQKKLQQCREAHEFDRKTYESLLGTVGDNSEMPDPEFAAMVRSWVQNVISGRSKAGHESQVKALFQDDCETHKYSMELQLSLLQKSRQERDQMQNEVVALKAQVTEIQKKNEDSDASKIQAQLTGEKQYLLEALSKAQATMNDLTNTYNFIEKDRATLKKQLKDARDLLKTHEGARDISNAERDRLESQLKQVVEQGLKVTSAYSKSEDALAQSQQDLFQSRIKLQIVEHALQITGIRCDVWNLKEAASLVTAIEDFQESTAAATAAPLNEQEAQLAASCAQLSATNESLETSNREQKSKIRDLKTTLATVRSDAHSQHKEYYRAYANANQASADAKREAKELQTKVSDLETRLQSSTKEECALRVAQLQEERARRELEEKLAEQVKRRDAVQGCLTRGINTNRQFRKTIDDQVVVIRGLNEKVERTEEERESCRCEIRRLTGLLDARDEAIVELEQIKEGLEKRLVLGDGEFVEVEEGDVDVSVDPVDEYEEAVVVQGEIDGEDLEFEEVELDENGDGVEVENGKAAC